MKQPIELPSHLVLADFIRDQQNLRGTTVACREGDCGACTVMLGYLEEGALQYKTITSCIAPSFHAGNFHLVTIEGLELSKEHPLVQIFNKANATQCGFCTPGFVISAMAAALNNRAKSEEEFLASMDGNICRCTGYHGIFRAYKEFYRVLPKEGNTLKWLVAEGFLPTYFLSIPKLLQELEQPLRTEVERPAHFIGGGTDLLVQMPDLLREDKPVSLIRPLGEMPIEEAADRILIAGGASLEQVRQSTILNFHFPFLKEAMKLFASTQIRNLGTVAGNIVNASPIGDLTCMLIAMDARLLIKDKASSEISLDSFFLDYKVTQLQPGEKIAAISIEAPPENAVFKFEKLSKRRHLDIASVNTASLFSVVEGIVKVARFSAGGVYKTPLLLRKASTFLLEKEFTVKNLQEFLHIADQEIKPISDVRGTEEYKRLALRQLLLAQLLDQVEDITPFKELIYGKH